MVQGPSDLRRVGLDNRTESFFPRSPRRPRLMRKSWACDRREVHEELERREADAVIPPRRDAVIRRHGKKAGPRLARDEDLRRIREIGRRAWKEESGYHRRSLGETAMFRLKAIFGGGVSSRRPEQQAKEVGIRCRALNIMTHRGMPVSERVVA